MPSCTPQESATPLQELEIKLAFLERANAELGEVIYDQQRTLDALRARIELLEAQVDVLRETSLKR